MHIPDFHRSILPVQLIIIRVSVSFPGNTFSRNRIKIYGLYRKRRSAEHVGGYLRMQFTIFIPDILQIGLQYLLCPFESWMRAFLQISENFLIPLRYFYGTR